MCETIFRLWNLQEFYNCTEDQWRNGVCGYISFIGDGDSASYNGVRIEKSCKETVFIPKVDCIAHVSKKMGINLTRL